MDRFSVSGSMVAGAVALAVLVMAAGGNGAAAQRPSKPGGLTVYLTGNSADSSRQPVNGPGVLLMGGNYDIDEAFINRAYPIVNGGDVVVLRTNKSSGYNNYLYNLVSGTLKPDSVETIVVDSRTKANSAYVKWAVETAEFVWIAGGDQSVYLNNWQDTATETAIKTVYNRGGVIGGISAGCAVAGEFMYDPDGVSGVTSSEAIANPYRSSMIISTGFLDLPLMDNIITDTHFYQRGRMGRSMAFMARLRQDGRTASITGISVDEDTSVFIDRNRVATVDGDFSAYILREDASTVRTRVQSGQSLIYEGVLRTRLTVGDTFNLNTGASNRTAIRLDVDGRYPSDPYTPSNPY